MYIHRTDVLTSVGFVVVDLMKSIYHEEERVNDTFYDSLIISARFANQSGSFKRDSSRESTWIAREFMREYRVGTGDLTESTNVPRSGN